MARLARCSFDAADVVGVADECDEGDDGGGSTGDGGCYRESCDTPSDCARHDGGTSRGWKRSLSRTTSRNRKSKSSSLNLAIFAVGCVSDSTAPAGSSCRAFYCPRRPCLDDDGDGLSLRRRCGSHGATIDDLFRASY